MLARAAACSSIIRGIAGIRRERAMPLRVSRAATARNNPSTTAILMNGSRALKNSAGRTGNDLVCVAHIEEYFDGLGRSPTLYWKLLNLTRCSLTLSKQDLFILVEQFKGFALPGTMGPAIAPPGLRKAKPPASGPQPAGNRTAEPSCGSLHGIRQLPMRSAASSALAAQLSYRVAPSRAPIFPTRDRIGI